MTFTLRSLRPMLAVVLPLSIVAACSSGSSTDDEVQPAAGTAGTAGKGGSAGKSGASGKGGKGGSAGKGTAGDDGEGGTDGEAGEGNGGESSAGEGGSSTAGKGGSASGEGGSSGQGGAAGETTTAGAAGQETGGTDAGGQGGATGGSDAGGTDSAGGTTPAGAGGAAGAAAGSGGAAAGTGGAGGKGGGWPTCDEPPAGSTSTTVSAIWTQNPATYTPVWLPGLTITAISYGACDTSHQCLLFLQTKPTYASLQEGAHQGIKLFVSEKASPYFTGLKVGDVVNLYGNAIRYTQAGQNELRIQVELEHPGCAKVVGTATPAPITGVNVNDLTADAYENTIGPLLVRVDTVKGRPAAPGETFAIYNQSFKGPYDAGIDTTETLTPYYLPGGQFQGLTASTWTSFTSITGVFSTFVITSGTTTTRYRTLGPRTQDEIIKAPVSP